jgi:hypothetical protein
MQQNSLQPIGNLIIGDRFCFPKERKREIVCEIKQIDPKFIRYSRDGSVDVYTKDRKQEVIYLRSI